MTATAAVAPPSIHVYRLAITIAVAAIAALVPPAAAAGERAGCGPRSAQTVEQTRLVRVFVVRERYGSRSYRACMRTGGRSVRLEDANPDSGLTPDAVGRFTVHGRFVAYVSTACVDRTDCDFAVSLTDVRRRRDVWETVPQRGKVGTIVATNRGQAAFVGVDPGGRERYVVKLDSYGASERDRGQEIAGLALHGRRIHWRNGSISRSEQIAHVRRCGPPRGTVAMGRSARVFSVASEDDEDEYAEYACLFSGGRPMYLGTDSLYPSTAYTSLGSFRVMRGYVVWLEVSCMLSSCSAKIHSADLRARTSRVGEMHPDGELRANDRGHGVLVTHEFGYPRTRAIYALDSTGERELDNGAGIDPDSVTVGDAGVTWTHDGEPRSAELR